MQAVAAIFIAALQGGWAGLKLSSHMVLSRHFIARSSKGHLHLNGCLPRHVRVRVQGAPAVEVHPHRDFQHLVWVGIADPAQGRAFSTAVCTQQPACGEANSQAAEPKESAQRLVLPSARQTAE